MTVNVSKSQFNIREKLKDLERPSTDKLVTRTDSGVYIDKLGGVVSLSNIHRDIADTATDVFVYDTSKDSDGGAWRKRTQNTSWYNETLGTSVRGTRREFPAVAVIVSTEDDVIIYDGDDPDLPMWMIFESGSSGNAWENYYLGRGTGFTFNPDVTGVAMLNATLVVVKNGGGQGNFAESYTEIRFISDRALRKDGGGAPFLRNSIVSRNGSAGGYYATNNDGIVHQDINDVAMTVLPNAPIDPSTGLPIPTIAVATQQGISIITDSGTVYDLTPETNAGYSAIKNFMQVAFTKENHIVLTDRQTSDGFSNVIYLPFYNYDQDLTDTYSKLPNSFSYEWNSPINKGATQVGEWKPQSTGEEWDYLTTCSDSFVLANGDEPAGIGGIVKIGTYPNQSMVNRITKDYNTGWAYGLTQGIFLSDTDDTNKTNGQTDPDRSHNNTALTVTGTITKTPVATGADLVAYNNGGSNTNYLEQPYNSGLDFGTNDFSVCVWFRMPDCSTTGFIFDRADSSGNERFSLYTQSDAIRLYTYNVSGSEISTSLASSYDNQWIHYVVNRHSSGLMEAFINGVKTTTTSPVVRNVTNTDAHMVISGRYAYNSGNQHLGDITLLRISGSVPSPEQIKKMYNDEKFLFQENAKATLYGSSDAVTALAFDEVTDQLHVGTSSGRSDFQGLRRINNTTTAVTTAISAHDEFIIEQ